MNPRLADLMRDLHTNEILGVQRGMTETKKAEAKAEESPVEGAEAGHDIPAGDPAFNTPVPEAPPEDTTCEASGTTAKDSPVPEEQRHPYACPVCGKLLELGKDDEIPEHDDLRLVPEEPDDWRTEAEKALEKASKS